MMRTLACCLVLSALVGLAYCESSSNLPMKQHPSFRHAIHSREKKAATVRSVEKALSPSASEGKYRKHSVLPSSANFDLEEEDVDTMFDSIKPTKISSTTAASSDVANLFAEAEKKENDKFEAKMALERLDHAKAKKSLEEDDSDKLLQGTSEPEYALRLEREVKELTQQLNDMKHEIKQLEETQQHAAKPQQEKVSEKKAPTQLESEKETAPQTHNKKHKAAAPAPVSEAEADNGEAESHIPIIDDIADAASAKLTDWGLLPSSTSDNDKKADSNEVEEQRDAEEQQDAEPKGIVDSVMQTLGLESEDKPVVAKKRLSAKQDAEEEKDSEVAASNDSDDNDANDANEEDGKVESKVAEKKDQDDDNEDANDQ